MKIVGSKATADPVKLVSISEDITLNYNEGGPAIVLEDESVILFESVASYNAFLKDSSFYDIDSKEVDMEELEASLEMEDDVDSEQCLYYGKPVTSVAIYDMDGDRLIRLFREDFD